MSSAQPSPERLRRYLQDLKPEARASLLADLEAGTLTANKLPGADLIVAELRRMRGDAAAEGAPDRRFFASLAPFVINDNPARKHPGRIARDSLDQIWRWIARDLAPRETAAFADALAASLKAGEKHRADGLVRGFQERVGRAIDDVLAKARRDPKAEQQMAAQIGTPKAIEEVAEIAALLKAHDALSALGKRLPPSIRNLSEHQLDNVKTLLDAASARAVFLYALLVVMSRLAAPWHVIRLATKAAGTDDADRVAESSYALAVPAVLAEMEAMVWRLSAALKAAAPRRAASLLKDIHDSARGLRTELHLSADSAWARQLAAVRSEVSKRVGAEIDAIPGKVRSLLRPRMPWELARETAVDPIDIAETEAAVEFVGLCRTYASELAINEATLRVSCDLQGVLERETATLLEALRQAGDGERPYRQSQLDAAVRLAGKVFGGEYASLLAKAAEVARSDRKIVRA
jgi:hypothetical protein